MRLALLVASTDHRRLAYEATRHGHEVIAASADPDVIVVAADPRFLGVPLVTRCDASGIAIVVLVGDDAGRRLAADLGLYETVDASADWLAIERAFIAGGRNELPAEPRRGRVVAVWGPSGAPGRSTLAIGIAAELALLGHRVVLADVDTHGASIAPALGMLDEAPGFAAACRLASTDSLSLAELERVGQWHESSARGFWVLTGIGRPSRWPELSAQRVSAVIRACRDWADFTVLDTSASLENDEEISSDLLAPRRNAATVTAVHEADEVVAVSSADPVGLARFLRTQPELSEVATGPVTVVANKVRASAIGLGPAAQVRRTLSRFGGIDSPVLVPFDLGALDGAVLSGRTLTDSSPRSPARIAIRDLAATLASH